MNIIDTMFDENLFGTAFGGESWSTWRVFLKALFGLEIDDAELGAFRQHSGGREPPERQVSEAWVIAGRRGGKSSIAALVAVYLAAFRDYSENLAPGEVATVAVIAADRRQARTIMRYCQGLMESVAMLSALIEKQLTDSIYLRNRVVIEVHTCSFRSVRGYSLAAVIADEIAFWRSDDFSANPDREVLASLRPGMASLPEPLLLCISSPHSRHGELWQTYRRHYGKNSEDVLVWQAPSATMNPTLSQRVIDRAFESDPDVANSEFGAEFRSDLESYIPRDVVEALVATDRHELPPQDGITYRAFCDPSGGRGDSFTLAIAHRSDDRIILDALRERHSPFSPKDTVADYADLLRRYRLSEVTGDRYSGEWVASEFRSQGITYQPASKPKNQLYSELLPSLNTGEIRLLDSGRLISQLCGLERRVLPSGREQIDHPPGAHDDLANAVAGVAFECQQASKHELVFLSPDELAGRDRDREQQGHRDLFQESLDRMRVRGM